MSVNFRRIAGGVLALSALVAIAVCSQQAEAPTYTFRITLGLTDKQPTDWSGQVAVADGEVIDLAGWRFEEKDAVDGVTGWKCSTRSFISPEARYPLTTPGKAPPKPPEKPWPNGVTLTVRGRSPTVTLTVPGGAVKFKA